ncbi:MAG TPA: hypothetical protein ENN80_04775, partial [Candidatus Hydrogenedentes bacterium]|nr:hypothetical protein [Candidatus Hydrogenedentota bacterium]
MRIERNWPRMVRGSLRRAVGRREAALPFQGCRQDTRMANVIKGRVLGMQQAPGANDPAAAIAELKAAVRGAAPGEQPQIGRLPDGCLRFFGAPPGGYVDVDLPPQGPGPSAATADERAEQTARAFLAEYGAAFGIRSSQTGFSLKRITRTYGRTHVRLSQTYNGLPVFGAEIIVHLDPEGEVEAVISDIMRDTSLLDSGGLSLTPSIEAADALASAKDFCAAQASEDARGGFQPESDDFSAFHGPDLVVLDPGVVGKPGKPGLAWSAAITASCCFGNRQVFVNAHSGNVCWQYGLVAKALQRDIYRAGGEEIGSAEPPTYLICYPGGECENIPLRTESFCDPGEGEGEGEGE